MTSSVEISPAFLAASMAAMAAMALPSDDQCRSSPMVVCSGRVSVSGKTMPVSPRIILNNCCQHGVDLSRVVAGKGPGNLQVAVA